MSSAKRRTSISVPIIGTALCGLFAIALGAGAAPVTHLPTAPTTEAGIISFETSPGACGQANLLFDVNQHTSSVGLRYQVIDAETGQLKAGWTTPDEIRNVTPGSTGNAYIGHAIDEGDVIVFGILPYTGINGTGSLGPAPKAGPQASSICT